MKTIPLTRAQFAVVDDIDYELVSQFKWYAQKRRRGFHAARRVVQGGRSRIVYMHQVLIPGAIQVDHKDGDGLNNRRENLRSVTKQQNHWAFQSKPPGKSSRFRGVRQAWKEGKKWTAQIMVNRRQYYLGTFTSEEDAARAYDKAARHHFGEFASPNFP